MKETVLQEKTCFLPRMLNCLLLGHGRCVLHCGCRPPCETVLSFATSALHRCMVGTRSMLSCLEACSQGDQATSTPGGSRGKSQKEPGGQQETEGARISYVWGRILARFLRFFVAKSFSNSGRARNNDSFLVSSPSNVEVAARKLRLQLALCRVIVTAMSRDKPVAT